MSGQGKSPIGVPGRGISGGARMRGADHHRLRRPCKGVRMGSDDVGVPRELGVIRTSDRLLVFVMDAAVMKSFMACAFREPLSRMRLHCILLASLPASVSSSGS